VEDRQAAHDEIVGDDASMAAPPNRLGAHDRADVDGAKLDQFRQTFTERPGLGVVGIVPETGVLPEDVRRWPRVLAARAQTAQGCDVAIADPSRRQVVWKDIHVEPRIGSRPGHGADIDDHARPYPDEQRRHLINTAGRMADGKEGLYTHRSAAVV
jgi:hypothetical protein